jgi:hypothetical protein
MLYVLHPADLLWSIHVHIQVEEEALSLLLSLTCFLCPPPAQKQISPHRHRLPLFYVL